ncbi:MAG TPA: hypothetical protein VF815_44185 [Myxococcaceae bacterium]
MSAPKPITVVLILAVFAIIALYVLGLGLGATDDTRSGRSPMSPAERSQWRNRLMKPRPVKVEEVRADCPFAGGVLSVEPGRPCRVTIEETGARARIVEVVRVGGAGTVGIAFTPKSKPALPLSVDNLTGARKLDVAKEGAELVVSCAAVGGQRCQVRLQ